MLSWKSHQHKDESTQRENSFSTIQEVSSHRHHDDDQEEQFDISNVILEDVNDA